MQGWAPPRLRPGRLTKGAGARRANRPSDGFGGLRPQAPAAPGRPPSLPRTLHPPYRKGGGACAAGETSPQRQRRCGRRDAGALAYDAGLRLAAAAVAAPPAANRGGRRRSFAPAVDAGDSPYRYFAAAALPRRPALPHEKRQKRLPVAHPRGAGGVGCRQFYNHPAAAPFR